ncbi:hypothetical protein NDU88_006435 [Pleurodeles waltl]|uniref:Uncharacterized protein n=1 Tax=Pleurodeles waltl TaxID=8319 RepID=A0AAV7MZ69_PLEWA|nr:hypothetical protein NDU88_006435 [Pleurodeles waltl]
MTGGKGTKASHQTKLDKCTLIKDDRTSDGNSSRGDTEIGRYPSPKEGEGLCHKDIMKATFSHHRGHTDLDVDLCKMEEKVNVVEDSFAALMTDAKTLRKQVGELQATMVSMVVSLEGYEGRSRRNYFLMVSISERTEGPSADLFLEDLILNMLKPQYLSSIFYIERSHRVPGASPRPGATPRTIIASIFNHKDCDVIFQAARRGLPFKYDNAAISFFPDFSLRVQRFWRSFDEV